MQSLELFQALYSLDYLDRNTRPYWWPNYRKWEVVIEAILTQQTKWERVEASIANLKSTGFNSLEAIANGEQWRIASAITPSGFYNQKAVRIITLVQNLLETFGGFEEFCEGVSREWLLAQKGIGKESADSILCYGCGHNVMVVDAYTNRLLSALGYTFDDYDDLKSFLELGMDEFYEKNTKEYSLSSLNELFALYHGLFVEFGKRYCAPKKVDLTPLKRILESF